MHDKEPQPLRIVTPDEKDLLRKCLSEFRKYSREENAAYYVGIEIFCGLPEGMVDYVVKFLLMWKTII